MLKRKLESFFNRLGYQENSLSRKVIGSGLWVGSSSVVLNIVTLIRSVVLARLLAPEVFGLMAICYVVIKAVEVFTQTGFSAALIHRQGKFEEAKDTAFTLIVIRGFLLALIVFLVSPFIAVFYEKPILNIVIQVIAISFIFNGFRNINTIAQQKELNFKKLVYLEQVVAFLNTIVVITVAYYFRNIWALVIGHVSASFIGMVFSYILIPGGPKFKFDKKIALELFHYGKYITGVTIVLFAATEIDNALIGKLLGVEALGFYFLAFMLANLPTTHISKIANKILFPAYSKLQNNYTALSEAYLRVIKLIGNIVIPASVGIMVLSADLITIIYGEKWQGAIAPLQILCVFGGVRAIAAINGYLLNGIGKPNIDFYIITVRLIAILILIYPMTLNYGLIGASITVTLAIIIQLILSTIMLMKIIKLNILSFLTILIKSLIYSVVMAIVLIILKNNMESVDVVRLVGLVVVGALTYFLLNYRLIISIFRGSKNYSSKS